MVTAAGVADKPVSAAPLACARQAGGPWMAGIAFLYSHWSHRALVTVWVPAPAVKPHHGGKHAGGPRLVR
jgi:hypothetical protein